MQWRPCLIRKPHITPNMGNADKTELNAPFTHPETRKPYNRHTRCHSGCPPPSPLHTLHLLIKWPHTYVSGHTSDCECAQSSTATVFQRRMGGSENFNRTWDSDVDGFGKLYREHWLGLDKIHCLTASKGRAELYVDMYDCDGVRKYARYSYFHVEGSSVNYKLHISGYSRTAGDSFTSGGNLNGMQFTTRDRDNDLWSASNCAAHRGAWWYYRCGHCNLNGPYICGAVQTEWVGVMWGTFGGGTTPSSTQT